MRLVNYAKANGLQAECWFENTIRSDRLAFLIRTGDFHIQRIRTASQAPANAETAEHIARTKDEAEQKPECRHAARIAPAREGGIATHSARRWIRSGQSNPIGGSRAGLLSAFWG